MSLELETTCREQGGTAFEGFDHTQSRLFKNIVENRLERQVAQLEVDDEVYLTGQVGLAGRIAFFHRRDVPAAFEAREEIALRSHGDDARCGIEANEACKGAVDELRSDRERASEGVVRSVGDFGIDAPREELGIGFDIEDELEERAGRVGESAELVKAGHDGA